MIRIEHAHLPVSAITHPGMKGKNNEDRFAVSAYRLSEDNPTPSLLAVLSDGIGGHRGGEVAAEITVNRISQQVAESDGSQPAAILQEAIEKTSADIYAQSQTDPALQGMGATCACAWIVGDRVFGATVGDSRLYLLRAGGIQQLSTDHTWVQEAVANGLIKPDEVRGHPNQHVIRRYLGSSRPPNVDLRLRITGQESDTQAVANQGMLLREGDRLLLCTDGLHDLVEDEEILAAFGKYPQATAIKALVALANERGGHDNITVIAIEVPATVKPAPKKPARRGSLNTLMIGCAGALLLAALVTVIAAGVYWFNNNAASTPQPSPTSVTATLPQTEAAPAAIPTQLLPTVTPEATLIQATPGAELSAPVDNGPTLTPWPTNTPAPTFTPTNSPTAEPSDTQTSSPA
jgi:serine/threonine protein phosphatase PrpC